MSGGGRQPPKVEEGKHKTQGQAARGTDVPTATAVTAEHKRESPAQVEEAGKGKGEQGTSAGGKDAKRGEKKGVGSNSKAAVAKRFVGEILQGTASGSADSSETGRGKAGKVDKVGGKAAGPVSHEASAGEGKTPSDVAAKSGRATKEPKQNYVPPRARAQATRESAGSSVDVSAMTKTQVDAGLVAEESKAASKKARNSAPNDAGAPGKPQTKTQATPCVQEPAGPQAAAAKGNSSEPTVGSAGKVAPKPRGGRGRARDGVLAGGSAVAVASEGN